MRKRLLTNSRRQRMSLEVEYQFVAADSEARVYLIPMPEVKDSIPERIAVWIIKLFFSYSVADFVSPWAVRKAYEERGYTACGGEYILIALSFIISYCIVGIFFRYFRRTKTWKKEK